MLLYFHTLEAARRAAQRFAQWEALYHTLPDGPEKVSLGMKLHDMELALRTREEEA